MQKVEIVFKSAQDAIAYLNLYTRRYSHLIELSALQPSTLNWKTEI